MKAHRKRQIIQALILGISFVVLFSPLYMYFSHDVADLRTQYPHIEYDEDQIVYEIKDSKPRGWVPLNHISRYLKWGIVLSEDWAFYQHQGIDIQQIKVAFKEVFTAQKIRGASTITQQMVKNVFLSDERTLWRKLHEIILSQKVEKVLTKDRILEIYLNCIEFGPNVYGIREASYHYFKKHPSALSPKEGAFLAMMLPSPKGYYVSFKKKKLTPFATGRIKAVLRKMRIAKVLSYEQYKRAMISRLSWEKP